jgi:hypothetical protein
MVVIQYGTRMLKGYTDRASWPADALDGEENLSPPICPIGQSEPERFSLRSAKAVFFVHSFAGRGEDPIQFHADLPHKDMLWVRVIFRDGEVMEGMIQNSKGFLFRETLALSPSDPEGNNWLVLVSKRELKDFHVLGLRGA